MHIETADIFLRKEKRLNSLMQERGFPNVILSPTNTPLLNFLVLKKQFRMALELVEAGADLNLKTTMGYTVLKLSIQHGNLDFSNYLVDCGADFYPNDDINDLCCAIYSRKPSLIEFVLNDCGDEQLTESAFFAAACFGNLEFIANNVKNYTGDLNLLMSRLNNSKISSSTLKIIGKIVK